MPLPTLRVKLGQVAWIYIPDWWHDGLRVEDGGMGNSRHCDQMFEKGGANACFV